MRRERERERAERQDREWSDQRIDEWKHGRTGWMGRKQRSQRGGIGGGSPRWMGGWMDGGTDRRPIVVKVIRCREVKAELRNIIFLLGFGLVREVTTGL